MSDQQWSVSRRVGLFAAYVAVLVASHFHDALQLSGPPRASHIGYDSYLVLNRLERAARGAPFWSPLGYYAPQTPASSGEGSPPSAEKVFTPYTSQLGLQGIVLGGLMNALHCDPLRFAHLAAGLCCLATAAVLAVFFVSIAESFGAIAAHVGVFMTALSPIFLEFAPSVYWCCGLLFAPFVVAWIWYPRCRQSRQGLLALWAVLLALIVIKCLCGYEYVTTVILSPLVAVFFHQVRLGEFHWKRLFGYAGGVATGCAGFFLALTMHVAQVNHYVGGNGLQTVLTRAKQRTIDGYQGAEVHLNFQGGPLAALPESVSYPLNCFLHYFNLPAIAWPGGRGNVKIWAAILFGGLAVACAAFGKSRLTATHRALSLALGLSLVTSLSWQVAAINHMCVHFHLNTIVFYAPFLLLTFVAAGCMVQAAALRLRVAMPLENLLGPAMLLLLVGSAWRYMDQQVREQGEAMTAGQRVLACLKQGQPLPADAVVGHVDVMQTASGWTFELDRSALVDGAAGPGQQVTVSGWAADTAQPNAPKRLLFLQGERVLSPSRCVFYDRPDVEKVLNQSLPKVGFRASLPCPDAAGLQGMRIFVLAGDANATAKIAELTPPPAAIIATTPAEPIR